MWNLRARGLTALHQSLCVLLIVLFTALPVHAQANTDPLNWIPADFAGYVRLEIRDGDIMVALNIAGFAASVFQPERVNLQAFQQIENIIPLANLDVEDASFGADILPWLDDEVVIAYPALGPNFISEDTVLILPTIDALQSASNLSRIIQAQDLLSQEEYRDLVLYVGDKAAIVFTPQAVLVGPEAAIKHMLDVRAGEGERLIDEASYKTVVEAGEQNAIVSGYLKGSEVLRGLSLLLEGNESAVPVLEDIYEVLETYNRNDGLEKLVLGNALDGIGFTLNADTLRLNSLNLQLHLYDADYTAPVESADFNDAVLELLPQNAMVVQSGADASSAFYDVLVALPLTNFAGQILGAFPVADSEGSRVLDMPGARDIDQAVGGFLSVLARNANFDLESDLLRHFEGSYAVALLPRPNDPLPPLNLPYDVLLVAEVDDPEVAQESLARLMQILLNFDALETTTVQGVAFSALQPDPVEDPVLYIGAVDSLLVLATGQALERSLDARRGDNRLVNRERWQEVSQASVPQLYIDIPALYATFLPAQGGAQIQQIRQMSARTDYLGEGLFAVEAVVTLPGQFE